MSNSPGTAFSFSSSNNAPEIPAGGQPRAPQGLNALSPRGILIIEDSPTARLYLKKVIEMHFPTAKIHEADDGRAALQILTRDSVQLIISDLNMPRMDGRAFVQTLRKNSVLRKKPVLLLSTEKPTESELSSDPLLRFLLKPSDPQSIAKAALELLAAAAAS
jgi:two-component system chemotaxis response regulator CheY